MVRPMQEVPVRPRGPGRTMDFSEVDLACEAIREKSAAMERVYRAYEASIYHLNGLKAQISADQRSCRTCRYGTVSDYSFRRVCRNPLFRTGAYDPDTGRVRWTRPSFDRHFGIRSSGQACGREGLLYVPAHPLVNAWRQHPFWVFLTGMVMLVIALIGLGAAA